MFKIFLYHLIRNISCTPCPISLTWEDSLHANEYDPYSLHLSVFVRLNYRKSVLLNLYILFEFPLSILETCILCSIKDVHAIDERCDYLLFCPAFNKFKRDL